MPTRFPSPSLFATDKRRGAAIPVTLLALSLATALAVSGSFVARRASTSARTEQRAFDLESRADGALIAALSEWDTLDRGQQVPGSTSAVAMVEFPGARVVVWSTRLGAGYYWVVAEAATDAKPLRRRRLSIVVRQIGGQVALVPGRAWCELP